MSVPEPKNTKTPQDLPNPAAGIRVPARNRRWLVRLRRGILAIVLCALLGHFVAPWFLPIPETLEQPMLESATFTDRNGLPLRHALWAEAYRYEHCPLDRIPEELVSATLAAEDRRFWIHGGVDYLAIGRSVRDRLQGSRFTSGASTITQQLIKISSEKRPRNLQTKAREALLARQIEMRWTKKKILEEYLNRLDYGNLAKGCVAAARTYFQKPLSDLSLAECALLAGLPQGPTRLDPIKRSKLAKNRRDWVLGRMVELGLASRESVERAMAEPLAVKLLKTPQAAGHAVDTLKKAGETTGPVRTTIDQPLQTEVERILASEIQKLEGSGADQGAVIVLRNDRSQVLAWAGSADYAKTPFNAALAQRSAGSTLKPFTYGIALEQGRHAATLIADVPTKYLGPDGLVELNNYDRKHRGPVPLREALANSLNIPALQILNECGGAKALHGKLLDAGLTTLEKDPNHYGLGLTLGNAGVSLVELTNAYAALARLGTWHPWTLRMDQLEGTAKTKQIFQPSTAWILADVLSDNAARSASFGTNSVLRLPFRCASKTGTSTDYRDNWCVGFTADFTVGVWIGNFANQPLKNISGVSGAGPVFHAVMLELHKSTTPRWPAEPTEIVRKTVDRRTGKEISAGIEVPAMFKREELFSPRHLPQPEGKADFNPDGMALLDDFRYADWFRSEENDQKHIYALQSTQNVATAMRILSPLNNAVYVLDPEIPGGGRKLQLKSTLDESRAAWSCDSLKIEKSVADLHPGSHRIVLRDTVSGEESSVMITVE